MTQSSQPYDSSLKSLLEGQVVEVLSHLVPEVEVDEELNDEVLKPPLRADRVYRGRYQGQICIVQIELETGADRGMAYRLLEYYGILLRKYRNKPVISVVIYPFRTSIPESPLRVFVGREEILAFHFRVIALWELSAKYFLDKGAVSIYALLPTMQDATYYVLRQALDEMKQWHGDNSRRLAEQILWFGTFLQRSDMVSPEDKEKVEEHLSMFDSLLEENRFVRKKAAEAEARGRAEGRAEGKVEGKAEALRQVIIKAVDARFPSLTILAQQKVETISELGTLQNLIVQVMMAPDENTIRWLLTIPVV